jgi:large subunit ribosomal protein L28
MARVCAVTGKKPKVKNLVSHARNRVKSLQLPNLQKKRLYVPELGRHITLRLTARGLRTLAKKGNVLQTLQKAGVKF